MGEGDELEKRPDERIGLLASKASKALHAWCASKPAAAETLSGILQ